MITERDLVTVKERQAGLRVLMRENRVRHPADLPVGAIWQHRAVRLAGVV